MENINILMTRIDERLLHGQGQLWLRYLSANTVLIVNDEVSTDPIAQGLMKMIVSKDIAIRFFSVQKTIDIISKASPNQKIFIIVKNPQDALKLVEGGVPIRHINIGNIHKTDDKEMITNTIYLSQDDKNCIKKLSEKYMVEFDTRTTPSGDGGSLEVDIRKYI